MATPDFVHEIEIHCARAKVHAFLCDLQNYVPLHPLIESIEELAPADAMPRARRYRVVDRIPLGPFRLRAIYTASLESVTDHEVHGHARQSPGIRLHTVYELEEVAAGTRLVERVFVDAPSILRRFVVQQARASHDKTLQGMKTLLEEREAAARDSR